MCVCLNQPERKVHNASILQNKYGTIEGYPGESYPGKCSPSFIICPGRRNHNARRNHMARGEMPRHRTPCAHQNAEVVPGADSAQHYTGLGGKWQDQIFLALLLPALPLFLRERHPTAEQNSCLRGGRKRDDPFPDTRHKAELPPVTSHLT